MSNPQGAGGPRFLGATVGIGLGVGVGVVTPLETPPSHLLNKGEVSLTLTYLMGLKEFLKTKK